MAFQCVDGGLESTGDVTPSQILSNSSACRILAGLTKKIGNKLGAPIDVMTEKWLPARGVRLAGVDAKAASVQLRPFNPFFWCVCCLHHIVILIERRLKRGSVPC